MKRHLLYIAIACLSALFSGCEKEQNVIRDFPDISKTEITGISTTGITVVATFDEAFINDITDHGVVWGTNVILSVKNDFQMHGGKPTSSSFTFNISSLLSSDKEYYVRAFIVTKDKTIYGNAIEFKSLGSTGPVIEELSSLSLLPGELLTIKGKNFGNTQTTQLFIKGKIGNSDFDNIIPAEVKSISDAQIVIAYPSGFYRTLKVIIRSKESADVESSIISAKLPKFISITPATMCEQLEIIGENLKRLGPITNVIVNGSYIPLSSISDNKIVLHPQYRRKNTSIIMTIDNALVINKELIDETPFPEVTNAAPKNVRTDEEFILEGTNFPTCEGLNIQMVDPNSSINGALSITDVTDNRITIRSNSDVCALFQFQLRYYGLVIYTSDYMTTRSLVVTSVTPTSGTLGTEFTVTGEKFPDYAMVAIEYNSDSYVMQDIITFGQTEIKAKVSSAGLGLLNPFPTAEVRIGIYDCGGFQGVPFTLTSPVAVLTDFNPKSSDRTRTIVITGSNFMADPSLKVRLTDSQGSTYYLFLTEVTHTVIKALSPNHVPPGTYEVTIIYFEREYEFAQSMILTP